MDDELVPAVSVITPDIFKVRGERVMLDSRVAQSFGTETKRVNEAVARNPEKFSEVHTFQLSSAEHKALRSQIAASKTGRGGARYPPRVYTMKGGARLATVLNTDAALRAADMIIDTFLTVYEQVYEGRNQIAIPQPSQYRSSPENRPAIQKFKSKLNKALNVLLDTVVDVQNQSTVRDVGQTLSSGTIQHLQERLRTKGAENAKLAADTNLVLAEAEQVLAATRKIHAEADSIHIQNLESRIGVVKKLIDMSKDLEPAEFVELLETYEAEPDLKLIGPPEKTGRSKNKNKGRR